MTVPLRAALYLRVSTARQAEHDVSIPDQRRQGEAYCAARGYQLVETYVEPGASATNDRRPEFQRMIEAGIGKPAPFDVVIVHSFSRFFRDHFELEFYVRKLAKNGVKLVSITQEMGDDPDARHDAPDHGAVRRVPVQGERQARAPGLEGERAARLLERLAAADRLPRRRGRAARGEGQEEAGDRSAARRHGAADLPPRPGRRRHSPARWASRTSSAYLNAPPHLHPRRRALGHRAGSPHPDPDDLYRPPRVQQAQPRPRS